MHNISEIIEYLAPYAIEHAKAGCARSMAILKLIDACRSQQDTVKVLAERVAAQSELLTRKAECNG